MGRKSNTARASVVRPTHRSRGNPQLTLVETPTQLRETQKRKTWSQRDCKDVVPLTDRQQEAFECWLQSTDSSLALVGSPGTGKTYMACYLGINEVLNSATEQQQLIVIRSAVETRSQGFLPGTLDEKEAVYRAPYVDIFQDLFRRASTFGDMCDAGVVRFMTTSHVRGLTFDNAIIIVDEFQNLNAHELSSVVTRVGQNSRLILCGDGYQNDLHSKRGTEVSGFQMGLRIMQDMEEFDVVQFTHDDIVRSGFVKSWIIHSERYAE